MPRGCGAHCLKIHFRNSFTSIVPDLSSSNLLNSIAACSRVRSGSSSLAVFMNSRRVRTPSPSLSACLKTSKTFASAAARFWSPSSLAYRIVDFEEDEPMLWNALSAP
eukprot:TRINITY_DN107262_c0_g1_i1.p1 TRINITY_DN107262_c0_g1~~TRINITY_DN107262_c0_g1_i1.p1  ORF type:complete len:108 (+),score=7.37 TRINITY_DN107262_c0_g1_i1:178-501(+)